MGKHSIFKSLIFATTICLLTGVLPSYAESSFLNSFKIKGCGAGPGYATSSAQMRLHSITRSLDKDLFKELARPGMIGSPDVESVKRFLLRRFEGRTLTCKLILMLDGSIADLKIEKSSLITAVDTDALTLIKSGAPFRRSAKGEIEAYSITFPYVDISEVPVPDKFVDPDIAKTKA